MLEPEGLDDSLVPLLMILCLFVELLLEARDPGQVLLLLQKHAVTLQVSILDTFLALCGQLLDCLFFLFVEGDALLLVFKEGHQMVVLLCAGL